MKPPEEYAKELLNRKGEITEYHLTHLITRAMRDTRDACARAIEEKAELVTARNRDGYINAAEVLRMEFVIGGPVRIAEEFPEEVKNN